MKTKTKIIIKILLIILAIVPLLGIKTTGYTLLIFPIFVFFWLFEPVLKPFVKKIPLPLFVKFVILGAIIGLLTEYFVFKDHTFVFSENLFHNLILSLGIYNSLIIIWYFLLKKYRFSLTELFITVGFWGIFFEQELAVFLSFDIVAYLYVFVVYGSIVSIPFLLVRDDFNRFKRKEKKTKYIVAFIVQWITYITGSLWILLLQTIFRI